MSDPFDWDKAFEEIADQNRKEFEKANTPEAIAERARKKQEEHERGVRLGWWDEEGNPLNAEEGNEDDDEDDETDGGDE